MCSHWTVKYRLLKTIRMQTKKKHLSMQMDTKEMEEHLTAGKKLKPVVDGGKTAPGTPQKTKNQSKSVNAVWGIMLKIHLTRVNTSNAQNHADFTPLQAQWLHTCLTQFSLYYIGRLHKQLCSTYRKHLHGLHECIKSSYTHKHEQITKVTSHRPS